MKYFVYEIICSANSKVYVGVSNNPERRFKEHKYRSFNIKDRSYNLLKERTIRKYGKESLTMVVIYQGCKESCIDLEIERISYYRDLGLSLNSSFGGEGSDRSTPWNKETKGLCKPNKTSFKKGSTGNKKLTEEQELEICDLYKKGYTYKEIHELCNLPIAERSIRFCLDRYGLVNRRYVTNEDSDKFVELKGKGYTLKEISEITGFGERTVSHHLKVRKESSDKE